MNRAARGFIPLLATLLISVWAPGGIPAERSAGLPRVGVIAPNVAVQSDNAQGFRDGLRDAGYAEGRNIVIDWWYGNGSYDQLEAAIASFVDRKVDVIVVESTVAALATKRATSTIPIVMAAVADPVGSGLVARLGQPGGNLTGLSMMTTDLSAKRLELLKEAMPRVTRVAVLWNPLTPWHPRAVEDIKRAAPSLSIELTVHAARNPEEITAAISAASRGRAEALYVIEDGIFWAHRTILLNAAGNRRLPVIGAQAQFAESGALLSYGLDVARVWRQSAQYVDRILKGDKPVDLPIQQPTTFDLVVNLKTAKALAIRIPPSILARADKVVR
jgi:putative tryptophan/tyrosine transport system substrate-binding protein